MLILELFNFVCVFLKNIVTHDYSSSELIKRFFGIFLQIGYSDYRGALWFLTNIFLCYIVAYILIRAFDRKAVLLTLPLYVLSYIWCVYLKGIYLLWRIELVPVGLVYLCVGYSLKEQIRKKRDSDWKLITAGIVISFVLIWWNYIYNDYYYAIDSHSLGNVVTSPFLALIISFTVVLIARIMPGNHTKMLQYMGRNSMVYYGVQQAMVSVTNMLILKAFGEMGMLESILVSFVALAVSLLIDTVLVYIWNRCFAPKISVLK